MSGITSKTGNFKAYVFPKSTTTTFSVVADATARDALPTPASGDRAWLKDGGGMDEYTSSWGDDSDRSRAFKTMSIAKEMGVEDSTNSSTTGDIRSIIAIRADQTVSLDGAPVWNGSAEVSGKLAALTFDSVEYALLTGTYTKTYDEIPCTTSKTANDVTDYDPGKFTATVDFTMARESGTAAISEGASGVLLFQIDGSTVQVTGTATVISVNEGADIDGLAEDSITLQYTTDPTETGIDDNMGVESWFLVTQEDSMGTYGTCFISSRTLSADTNGGATISESLRVKGAVTTFIS